MATQCTRCGKVLPRGDARFCNNCGAGLPIHQGEPSSSFQDMELPVVGQFGSDFSQSQSGSSSTIGSVRPPNDEKTSSGSRPALREQIAYEMPPRPSRRPSNDEPPDWMNQLGRGVYSTKPPAKAGTSNEADAKKPSSNIQDSTDTAKKEFVPGDADGMKASKQLTFPSPRTVYPVRPANGSPPRELHVKVWQSQGESDGFPVPENIKAVDIPQTQSERQRHPSQSMNDDAIEDLPTAHLAAEHISERTSLTPDVPTRSASSSPRGATPAQMSSHLDEVEQLETRPMLSQSRPSARPVFPTSWAAVQQQEGVVRDVQTQRNTPLPAVAVAPRMARSSRKRRKPFVFVLILLGLLVVGGLGTWIIVYQPFAVPGVTNTDQPFQNSTLNISLRYPQGWTTHIDQKGGSVSFYDSSHTGQVNVGVSDANGSMNQYIKKEETQLGMTGEASQPSLMFAGASWQQIKGSVVQNGATYSAVLLATEHNNRFYSIAQLAPLAVYAGEEQLAFSHIRSSFQFLS